MARFFASRFRRRMAAGFAGDLAPAGAQVVNDPAAGTGVLLRLPARRRGDPSAAPRRLQGYIVHGGGLLATWNLQLWIAAGAGDAGGDWIKVGDPLPGVIAGQLFGASGVIMDADVVIQCTPSAVLAGAETADLYLEESE